MKGKFRVPGKGGLVWPCIVFTGRPKRKSTRRSVASSSAQATWSQADCWKIGKKGTAGSSWKREPINVSFFSILFIYIHLSFWFWMCKRDIMEVTVTGRGYIPRKSSLRRLMKRHDLSNKPTRKIIQEPHSCNLNSFEVAWMIQTSKSGTGCDFSSNFPTPIGERTASSRILHDSIQQKCKLQLQPENFLPTIKWI